MNATPGRRPFYGWVIVGTTFTTQFLMNGCVFYGFSVMLTHLAAEFSGGDRAPVVAVQVLSGVTGMVFAPIVGRLFGRGYERVLVTVGVACVGLALLGISRATTLWQVALLFGTLVAFGGHTMASTGASTLVVHWFERRRATALAISQLGASVGGMVMAPVIATLVARDGWRGAYEILGIGVLCALPLVWWLVVGRPEQRGLSVDGLPLPDGPDAEIPVAPPPPRVVDALHQPNLWKIALAMGLGFMATTAVINHIVAFGLDAGFTAPRAALLASAVSGGAALGKLVFGTLSDRIGPRRALVVALLLQAVGLVGLLQVREFAVVASVVLATGIAAGGIMPLITALLAEAFGRHAFGGMMGLLWPIAMPIQLAGPVLAGWVRDVTGEYDAAFWVFVAAMLLGVLLVRSIRLPATAPAH